MTTTLYPFAQTARLAAPGDNAAIAVRQINAGSEIEIGPRRWPVPVTILESHRFAVEPVSRGGSLLSWGLPFGVALRDIQPGEYLSNPVILETLRQRNANLQIPNEPNFRDHFELFRLDADRFVAGTQVDPVASARSFMGFPRRGGRGVGTRNYLVILGTSSQAGGFARRLAERVRTTLTGHPNLDGIAAIAHTEGGGPSRPNNLDFILRTLAGFLVHPNVGAVLAVDQGDEPVNNHALEEFLRAHRYPLDHVVHRFLSIGGAFDPTLAEGERIVRQWLPALETSARSVQPLSHLKVALQCGGSDAFSGVSGNPLAGWIAREVIRHGGCANLAETDELIGAEPYVLANVRDLETARAFLNQIERFQERVGWHGLSAESNPSGGNLYRGLYNIAIKSIGAARKKAPDVRLDFVIDYAQPMTEPGYYFMDSPGNDLESIAGQVASGCNLVLFTTGNGSITNFPFVPTLKIMTNSGRFNLLARDMDINAGRYLEGESMDALGREGFELSLDVASGRRSVGERAGHSQVQLWREWRQTDGSRLAELQRAPRPSGKPLALRPDNRSSEHAALLDLVRQARYPAFPIPAGFASDRIGLILPTSLCSGQIGRMIADALNNRPALTQAGLSRFVALPHTEGCGVSGEEGILILKRTMAGYLRHPFVHRALLLEHGCEKTHNDAMRHFLLDQKADLDRFGWASVQLDGGIEKVVRKAANWFEVSLASEDPPAPEPVGLEHLRVGLISIGTVPDAAAAAFAELVRAFAEVDATVVLPANASLLSTPAFSDRLNAEETLRSTLAYGQSITNRGVHVMETPTDHYVETLTGLGATGVEVILSFVPGRSFQTHPMIPVVQATSRTGDPAAANPFTDLELALDATAEPPVCARLLLDHLLRAVSERATATGLASRDADFQITRGWLGVST